MPFSLLNSDAVGGGFATGPYVLPTLTGLISANAGDLLIVTVTYTTQTLNGPSFEPTTRTVTDNVGNIWTEIVHVYNPAGAPIGSMGAYTAGEGISVWACLSALAANPVITVTLDGVDSGAAHQHYTADALYEDYTGITIYGIDQTRTGFFGYDGSSSTQTPSLPITTLSTTFLWAAFGSSQASTNTISPYTSAAGFTSSFGGQVVFWGEVTQYQLNASPGSYTPGITSNNALMYDWVYAAIGFITVPNTFTISGTISGPAGNDNLVHLTGDATQSVNADSSGNYTFIGLSPGDYVVTPTQGIFTIVPSSRDVTITAASVANVNFSSSLAGNFQTWVYEFDTKTWFQLQQGFSSLDVWEVTPGNKILVGGGIDGKIYIIDDLTGAYSTLAANPIALWRTALIDFADPDHKHVLTYMEYELTNIAMAPDVTVNFYLDPVDADNPTASVPTRVLNMVQVPGANLFRGFFTGDGGGSICGRALIEINIASSHNAGGFRGLKLVADVASALAGSPLGSS